MGILRGSRYEGLAATAVIRSTGQRTATLNLRDPITVESIGPNYFIHTVTTGEDIDALAYRFSGRSDLWYVIAELNGITAPHREIYPGRQLIIPTPSVFAAF